MKFICYKKCSTCIKALNTLKELGFEPEIRDLKEDKLSASELTEIINKSGLDTQKFFNTSGLIYKNNNLKEKTKTMTDAEKIELLSTDGMLVKRPILITDKKIIVGFKKEEYLNLK